MIGCSLSPLGRCCSVLRLGHSYPPAPPSMTGSLSPPLAAPAGTQTKTTPKGFDNIIITT